jgi:16S rRNA (cytidine1402-2'-O)-methyltransferase
MPGTLHVVSTPIGNLEDITLRALRTLKEAALIFCEDTRRTSQLLTHYEIHKPLLRYDEHTHKPVSERIIRELREGKNVVLVSDAGTPGLSDPGQRLVAKVVKEGLAVCPIPGASALLSVLVPSGFGTDSFVFLGFLPRKKGPALRTLQGASGLGKTLVVFESPYRLIPTLHVIRDALGEVPVCLGRELTKIHEELLRGTPSRLIQELSGRPRIQGEIALAISIEKN